MKDLVFHSEEIEWSNDELGQSKILLPKSLLGGASVRLYKLDGHSTFESHQHSFLQVMFFQNNAVGKVTIDEEREYLIAKGLIVVIKPYQCHKIENTGNEAIEVLVIESFEDFTQNTPYVDF
ncbi:MAG: cupin domain-containing protein [Candidatus Heimdallarchaeota archaeon]|nr:cupin domain-containing protein [Candidatus Heimdallarchaeota archaeon]